MKIRFEKDKPVVRNTKVKDYICLNGKKLSEQTIYDYAQFIPKWKDRLPLDENDDVETTDCFLVSCVQPQNHTHNDDPALGGEPSMMISVGHTRNVVVHCRIKSCPDNVIHQYFLSRLTGEIKTDTAPVSAPHETYAVQKTFEEELAEIDNLTIDDVQHTDWSEFGMSKENQLKSVKETRKLHLKYKYKKPWKRLSEEEKNERIKEMISQSKGAR